MRFLLVIMVITAWIIIFPLTAAAGSIDSPAFPEDICSAMYSIDDLYHWLELGQTPVKRAGAFTEPSAGPGDSTHTLDDLWDQLKMIGRVHKTGQFQCYDAAGTEIGCPGTGQDGEHQSGVAVPDGDMRFTDNGDGAISDNLTGLVWLANADCFGTRVWEDALTDANGLSSGFCGLSDGSVAGDWRLPSAMELRSLVDLGRYNPALPYGVYPFTNVRSSTYWTSTTRASNKTYAWYVTFSTGYSVYTVKTTSYYVWPVRNAQ